MASHPVRVRLLLLTLALLCTATVGDAQAQAPAPAQVPGLTPPASLPDASEPEWRWRFMSFGADASVTSAYVWRGWTLDPGRCLQPDLWVAMGEFTVTSWASVHTMTGTSTSLSEHDLTVDYSHDAGRATLSAGWTNYTTFGDDAGTTNEFYGGLRLNTLLNPGVQVYHDVQLGKGTYVSLSASQDFPIAPRLSGTAEVALGYNRHQFTDVSGWSDIAVTFNLNIAVPSARLTLQPTIAYSHSLLPELFRSRVFGGLAVAFK
jgi:hypothetical protein